MIKNLIKPYFLKKNLENDYICFDEEKNEFCVNKKKDLCRLAEIPEERLCMNCFISLKKVKYTYTRYWCASCKVPLCPVKCYDKHRLQISSDNFENENEWNNNKKNIFFFSKNKFI